MSNHPMSVSLSMIIYWCKSTFRNYWVVGTIGTNILELFNRGKFWANENHFTLNTIYCGKVQNSSKYVGQTVLYSTERQKPMEGAIEVYNFRQEHYFVS